MYRIVMIARFFFCGFSLLLIAACGGSAVRVYDYDHSINPAGLHYYSWRGYKGIDSFQNDAPALDVIEKIWQYLEQAMAERNMQPATSTNAEVELALQLRMQNALPSEQAYRKKGLFSQTDVTGTADGNNALLRNVDPPLYDGQQRGTVSLLVYNAGNGALVEKGDATVVYPDDLNNAQQLRNLENSLRRLVDKLFD